MRSFTLILISSALLLVGCASETKPAAAPPVVKKAAKPSDETHRFPAANQVDAKLVDEHLLGHDFLPGGNIAHYKLGKQEYDLLLIKTKSPTDAAILLLNFKNKLEAPKMIAHFGGYFGKDGGKPVFLFAKNEWFCGVIGLPMADADARAREFAGRLN